MNFIFVSLQRINTDRESTSTSIAKELSKSHRVLYVNPPIDRKTFLLGNKDQYVMEHIQRIKKGEDALLPAVDGNGLSILFPPTIIESINWIPSTKAFSFLNKFNNNRFARDIQYAIDRLGFENIILIIDKDIFRSFFLKELISPRYSIYLYRDYTLSFPYWKRHGPKLEPKLASKCDAVVCNSSEFSTLNKRYNQNSYYISNGANLSIFDNERFWNMPSELTNLQRPLIGYVGALISSRLDIDLLLDIASNLTAGTIVLLGPQDRKFLNSDLHRMKNVHFIGKKNTADVPAYITHFDLCINPQLLNMITIGNFPLKIVEYLSMGKPIVAVATNTMKEVFSECTYLAENAAEFSTKIQTALQEDDENKRQKRIAFSKKYSWERVTQNLLKVIEILETSDISSAESRGIGRHTKENAQ